MKTFIIVLSIIISQSVMARICSDFIPDEWSDSRYVIETISTDNVVTDNRTGLMWKQCSEGLSGTGCMVGVASKHPWNEALGLPANINNTGYAGFNDWRIPNIEELRSISVNNCYNPAVNETAFPNTPSVGYWSSSPDAYFGTNSWYVSFNIASVNAITRGFNNHVRLVRSGR